MPKPLDEYARKRDFQKTPEPAGETPAAGERELAFVVHRHEARRLHYDLRLEVDGVLASFAVPKGFSYNPEEKRLAVNTEDHPMEYEHFEGVIPKGEYGAGAMKIWDRGYYRWIEGEASGRDAIQKGEIKIRLHGRKLRGEWHLVKLKKREGEKKDNNWLLFKSRDRYAGTERETALGIDLSQAPHTTMPGTVTLMEPASTKEPFSDPNWMFEMQFQGRRVLAEKRGKQTLLRGFEQQTPPALAEALEDLAQIGAENALLDGVLVALDDKERPSATVTEQCLAGESEQPLYYYAFDLLYYDEFDLRGLPAIDRKGGLRAILPPLARVLYVDHVAGNGESLAEAVAAAGLPAMIAKRTDSPYQAGPQDAWRKIHVTDVDGQPDDIAVSEALSRARPRGRKSRVKLSNLEKVYWPQDGFTKGDMLAFYDQVADYMLPYLADRPVHMNRFPDGIDGKSFYQKEAKQGTPDWVDTVPIESGSRGETVPYTVCNNKDTLLYLANLGSIDLHPWLSRRPDLLSPDWAVLDLDPKSAPFGDVVRIARECGNVLTEIGVRAYLKTSGKTGLHIYIPLAEGEYSYDHSRMFCEGVARLVASRLKDIATVERVLGSREGKVYVDFLQNRRGQTVVPPYCIRPVRGATVSTPLMWDELTDKLHPSLFNIQTVLPRISRYGDLFKKALTDRQDLLPAIEALQALLQ